MTIAPFDKHESINMEYNCPIYLPPPAASLNGGLFTGEAFDENNTYKNFPNKADSVYLHSVALQSANPPPNVTHQYPDSFRPGNNVPDSKIIGLKQFGDRHAIVCTKFENTEEKNKVSASLTSDLNNGFCCFHEKL